MAKKSFPKMLHVKIEEDSGTSYFVADSELESLASAGEKTKIATYELTEIGEAELIVKYTGHVGQQKK